VKVDVQEPAHDDLVRQFRYYLLTCNLPDIALRFEDAVEQTIRSLCQTPLIGPHYPLVNKQLQNLRSWPIIGFEAIKIYYVVDQDVDTIHIIRVIHGKRDVKNILEETQ